MGRYVAQVIAARLDGSALPDFRYRDFGTLACIDRASAVVNLHGLQLSGRTGWLFWLFVHIFFLIGFRNRLAVMWNWAWSYFNWQRFARIITGTGPSDGLRISPPAGAYEEPAGGEPQAVAALAVAPHPPAASAENTRPGDDARTLKNWAQLKSIEQT
jgi:hypothetical protein